MCKYLAKAEELRNSTEVHYNCAQAVFMAFSEDAGMDCAMAQRVAANFGSGMKCGGVCGAITGGLMALGVFGVEDAASLKDYYARVDAAFENLRDCAALLNKNAEAGGAKKLFCDGLVYACVKAAADILSEQGRI